jgi:hypothetical protein
VKTSFGQWENAYFNTEPFTADDRLYWHIKRAQDWVSAATTGTLMQASDPYELPDFPPRNYPLIAFNETTETFQRWQSCTQPYGLLKWKRADDNVKIAYLLSFTSSDNFEITCAWGKSISMSKEAENIALWYLLPQIPVLEPWQISSTWGELITLLGTMGIDLSEVVIRSASVTESHRESENADGWVSYIGEFW